MVQTPLNVNRQFLMNKRLYVLSSHKIVKSIDNRSFLNIDIPSAHLFDRDCIVAFKDEHILELLKRHMNHPYAISSVTIPDVKYYLEKSKKDLVIVNHLTCDSSSRSSVYTMWRLDIKDVGENLDHHNEHIPVFFNQIAFEAAGAR